MLRDRKVLNMDLLLKRHKRFDQRSYINYINTFRTVWKQLREYVGVY